MYPNRDVKSGKLLVTAAGTAEALGTGLATRLIIKALKSNTDVVYVGDSTVAAASGFELSAGEELVVSDLFDSSEDQCDISSIYVDAEVSGEGVSFVYCG